MEFSFYRGTTKLTPVIYVATADLAFSVGDKNTVQVKIPYQSAKGSLGSASGLSDISLCITRNIFSSQKFDVNVSVGTKIPSNDSNKTVEENGKEFSLPMYYQNSLGSNDIILGGSLISRDWLLATGVQYDINENRNQFLWSDWNSNTHDIGYTRKYAKSYHLKRGTDVMLRVERNFRFSQFNCSVGLLPIYRVTKDEIADPLDPLSGKRVKVDNTTGLALTALITAGYSFNVRSGMKLILGRRILNREVNPDGLTREFVSSISYYFRF